MAILLLCKAFGAVKLLERVVVSCVFLGKGAATVYLNSMI
jgi:hypothetical protein